jgi:hypothetical protein
MKPEFKPQYSPPAPTNKKKLNSKIWAHRVGQVIECLPGKCEFLSSNTVPHIHTHIHTYTYYAN